MSVRHSLLAILVQGPCYGYQLRGEFERRTGSSWSLNVGQIYNTLDRLERDGLVEKAAVASDSPPLSGSSSSSQIYYAVTQAGKREAEDWLNSPVSRLEPSRDELAIKVAVAATLPGVEASNLIRVQREATINALSAFTESRDASGDPKSAEELASLLVVDSKIAQCEAELAWLDRTEAQLRRASEAGLSPLALSSAVPKRGRPAGSGSAAG